MTDFQAAPLYGGELSAWYGVQTASDPSVPLSTASFIAPWKSFSFVDVPSIDPGVQMDSIRPIGSYTRKQRNAIDYRPSVGFSVDLQDITILSDFLTRTGTALPYLSMLFGTPGSNSYVKMVSGMKVDTIEFDIPIGGQARAKFNNQALLVVPSSVATLPAMSYNSGRALYGYDLTFGYGANTYTRLIKRIRIRISFGLVRGPVRAVDISQAPWSLAGSTDWVLLSTYLKETAQVTTVSFELTNPLPISDVNQICRTVNSGSVLLQDPCASGNIIRLSFNDLSFSTQAQGEGDAQSIVNFSAEADADTFTIANA